MDRQIDDRQMIDRQIDTQIDIDNTKGKFNGVGIIFKRTVLELKNTHKQNK